VTSVRAPTIEVATSVGRYKKYTEKDRFRIPNTLRSIGERAMELRFEVSDTTYNCELHALDCPLKPEKRQKYRKRPIKKVLFQGKKMVARTGIEPVTRGFSVR